jgi:BirA family biotin operon repressor/biotin-[acetyl-CoA-carboxylase] ligase
VYFPIVDSTQDEARAAALAGAPSRSVFVADFQQAGRGRQGRTWIAPPGAALLLSLLFREVTPQPTPLRWTSLASVALCQALEQLAPLRPAIKWPNDVLLEGRKVAGVLAESQWNGSDLVTVVGVGVNVSTDPRALEEFGATSLGGTIDRADLLRALIRRLDGLLAQPPDVLRAAWQRRLWGLGQRLRLVDLGREEDVVVLGVEPDGSLRVRFPDGSQRLTTTGELIH